MSAKPTSRRDFLKAAAGTVGAGVLATSGLQAGVKTAAAATTTARTGALEPQGVIWGLLYQPHVDAYHRMANLFKKKTGSTILVKPQPWPLDTKLVAALAAGTQPDAVNILGTQTVGLAVQHALEEISDSVYRANHIDPRRDIDRVFVRGSVEQFMWRGKIFGVPIECDGGIGSVVNVPVDDVRKHGLADRYPPTNGKFWFESYDDLFALAKALQVVKNGRVVKYGLCGEGWDDGTYWGIMLTEGTKPFDPEHKKFNFNTPAGVEAMYLHVEKPVKLGIEREWNNGTAVIDEVFAGKVALSLANGTPAVFGSQYGLHYELAGVPKINGRTPQFGGGGQGWGFVGPVHAPHPNLQAAWLRFVASRDGQYQYDLTYGGVVVVAWADIFFHDTSRFVPHDPNKNAGLKVMPAFRQILPNTENVGEVGYYEKVRMAIGSACQAVREGKLNSKQGAAQIQKLVEAQYRQYLMDVANA